VIVLLTLRDPSTGRDTEFLCRTTRDRLGVDALVIDVDAAREVSQGLCDSISLAAPALSDG
jgi:hypothetical protein